VSGSTRGLGRACANSLAREGVNVVVVARTATDVEASAAAIAAEFDVDVRPVVADVTTASGREAMLMAVPALDILVTNASGPSPSLFVETTNDMWLAALETNFLSAVALIQAVLPGMRERRFGRIVNITSAMVTSPHPLMTASVAARTALTGVTKAVSRDVVVDNVTINNILPERIDTERQVQMATLLLQSQGITLDEAYASIASSIAAKRLGRPDEVGDACAYLCSAQAGCVSGQNLHLDGGSYGGLVSNGPDSPGRSTEVLHCWWRTDRSVAVASARPAGRDEPRRGTTRVAPGCAGRARGERTHSRDLPQRRLGHGRSRIPRS
jgi:3-oxoacyl-[acyl-carrier protein] reductase